MKLLVPDLIVAATGEKTLRQYKIGKMNSQKENFNSDIYLAVTNRRVILHAEENKYSHKSNLLHNEMFIENVGGVSLFRGKSSRLTNFGVKFTLLFLLFAAFAAVLVWQSQPVFEVLSRLMQIAENTVLFKIIIAAVPMLIFTLIIISIVVKAKKFCVNIVIYGKGMPSGSLGISNLYAEEGKTDCIIIPYFKESHKMFSELGSLILDVQNFGPEAVLSHVDAEDTALL